MNKLEVLHQNYHMQGFTSDSEHKYMYWSFTDSLVKTNFNSTVICQTHVDGGHFGGLDWFEGKIYISYMRNPEPYTFFGDWSGFYVYVYNDTDLSLDRIIEVKGTLEMKQNKTLGFQGIDGIAFGKIPGTDTYKMFVAVALLVGEEYPDQLFLQCDTDGNIEKIHKIPAGNKIFGIQNLDYEEDTGCFWFTTYNASEPYQGKETLYKTNTALNEVSEKYEFSTPYGFECLGNGEYLCSAQYGTNGNRSGVAFPADRSVFTRAMNENDTAEYAKSV